MISSNHRASSVMIHLSDRESDGQFVEARFENRSWTGDKTALGEERIFFFSIFFLENSGEIILRLLAFLLLWKFATHN